jgi:hypothetical protein
MNSSNDIVITDGLIAELEKNFGAHTISSCHTWPDACELKGHLRILEWLKLKQAELREEQFENSETITIDSS